MRVALTGSSGKIGREAAKALKAAGHGVIGLDLTGGFNEGYRTAAVDCADFGEVLGALSGIDTLGKPDAVIHLAGIPAPGLAVDDRIFRINFQSTYNVFSACARLGINRVVWASSETILGMPYADAPAFLPLDETAPLLPNWSYALSKKLGEDMADQFVRWHPAMSIASLRFSNVFAEADYATRGSIDTKPDVRRVNLWGYVDARDCGEACRLAVEADFTGHEPMIIAATDSVCAVPSAELAARFFPDVPVKAPLEGNVSLLSSERARQVIGYEPRHSWRDRA
ncbi:NAD(P)-dependent oxidoreductase [Sphingobium sp. Sx8-8]|uniref:NAD-dependent epimerase/dehydratase family protein n=1 Tax=Sphingobium sp. Sx8-8 TaxID=2933617 RepID=UPI001F58894B|nr:NAD(P)-dependent oxidoreductase [Sphingobium sp. Sx8-8]